MKSSTFAAQTTMSIGMKKKNDRPIEYLIPILNKKSSMG